MKEDGTQLADCQCSWVAAEVQMKSEREMQVVKGIPSAAAGGSQPGRKQEQQQQRQQQEQLVVAAE